MKFISSIFFSLLLATICVSPAAADVNEILTFSNYTDEEIYVELYIYDDHGAYVYDVYVLPDETSVVDYWADTPYATYSVCAYGEITDEFYGCIDGGISDYYNHVYFDGLGDPYVSGPSGLPYAYYDFENPYQRTDVVVVQAEDGYHDSGGGCFIGGMLVQ